MNARAHPSYRPDRPVVSIGRLWWAVLIVFAGLYLLTGQRTFPWQDSGIRMLQVLQFDLRGPLGLALAHPGYIVMGQVCRLLPMDTFAGGMSFLSGLGMAVALANLAAIVATLTGRRWIGLATACMLGVAHTPWWLSTIAETYTWSLAGLTAELWLLVGLLREPTRKRLAALALVNGLGLCVHNFALLPLPVYVVVAAALVARRRLDFGALLLAGAAWLVGSSLYVGLTIEAALTDGLPAALRSALVGRFGDAVLNVTGRSSRFTDNLALMGMNFVSFLLPLAVVGWWRLRRLAGGPLAGSIAAITAIEIVFVVRYPVPDQFMFLLPSLAMIALAAGVGMAALADKSPAWRRAAIGACALSVLLPLVAYAASPPLARRLLPPRKHPGYRDEARYWLVPWKHNENSAQQYARAALAQAAPDGVIMADGTRKYALILTQMREGPEAVTVHHGEKALPNPQTDIDAFWCALAGRSLYTTDPAQLPACLREAVRAVEPAEGDVLYTLRPAR
ncbi:MAG: protein O-mannosyl-transferase family [Planctomycetota bacterium]